MHKEYFKSIDKNILYLEEKEEDKKRHEYESLMFNRDITSSTIKNGLDTIKN